MDEFLAFDLRSPCEIDLFSRKPEHRLWSILPPEGPKLSYREQYEQMVAGQNLDCIISENYYQLFIACRQVVKEAFELASSDAREKVWFFCHRGKDRTGIFIALILGLLGISMPSIEKDYSRAVQSARRSTRERHADCQAYLGLIYPGPLAIRSFIERIETSHGSIEAAIWGQDRVRAERAISLLRAKLLRE